jgi:hypothetical protein
MSRLLDFLTHVEPDLEKYLAAQEILISLGCTRCGCRLLEVIKDSISNEETSVCRERQHVGTRIIYAEGDIVGLPFCSDCYRRVSGGALA